MRLKRRARVAKAQRHHHETGVRQRQDPSTDGGVQCHCVDVDEPVADTAKHICDLERQSRSPTAMTFWYFMEDVEHFVWLSRDPAICTPDRNFHSCKQSGINVTSLRQALVAVIGAIHHQDAPV